MNIATNIKKFKNKKLFQIQLTEIIGVSKQSICDWEKGIQHIPDYLKSKKLSDFL